MSYVTAVLFWKASPILLIETLSTSGWFVAHLDKLRLQWRQDEKHADLRRISAQGTSGS